LNAIAYPATFGPAKISWCLRPFEFGGIEREQILSFMARPNIWIFQMNTVNFCNMLAFYYFPCKIKLIGPYSKYQRNISGILKGIFPMTDLKTVGAAAPQGPAEKVAMPVKPEAAPVSQPEKSAPEASPTKQV
jgi:hypothetical protein